MRIPPTMDYMRHWFPPPPERYGARVKFKVDRFFDDYTDPSGNLVFEDDAPLSGDRVAIWTYDDCISLSQVRISGEWAAVSRRSGLCAGEIEVGSTMRGKPPPCCRSDRSRDKID